MTSQQVSLQFAPKFVTTYNRLFQGLRPQDIAPNQDPSRFWSDLLELDVDREFLAKVLRQTTKEECLSRLKPLFNELIASCLYHARTGKFDDARKGHSVETLSVLSRSILNKNPAGWEVMEVFAGGVRESDEIFNNLTIMIDEILGDDTAPASLRHSVLQLAIVLVCGISQLSPGAYFLRRDLFPSIVAVITSPDTEQYTFEASLLLALLANFHKSDAAKLNPYLKRITETKDKDLMHKIIWASNFAADAVIKTYQNISDDSPPTLSTVFGSFLSSLRPDRALASKPVDPPRELFKDQPIEACVILLPIFEFLHASSTFRAVFLESLAPSDEKTPPRVTPLPYTVLTLASYLLTHASSLSSPRAIAYANLALSVLLVMAESSEIMHALCEPSSTDIRLCRQRLPVLLHEPPPRAPLCALLDCCVLWLRHNIHKRLEVYPYLITIRICYRVLWYLQKEHVRLAYHWQEFWKALIVLLDFLSTKLDSLITTGGIEQLVQEVILVLDLALGHSEAILPDPQALHDFIYELVRSAPVIRRQDALLKKLAIPGPRVPLEVSRMHSRVSDALTNISTVVDHYETKIGEAHVSSAKDALRIVAKEIEKDGLNYGKDLHSGDEPTKWSEDVTVVGFIRYAYTDGMSLMP